MVTYSVTQYVDIIYELFLEQTFNFSFHSQVAIIYFNFAW